MSNSGGPVAAVFVARPRCARFWDQDVSLVNRRQFHRRHHICDPISIFLISQI